MKTKTYQKDTLEYEDFSTPGMYFFSVLSIVLMVGILICFGIMIAMIVVLIGGWIGG